MTIHVDDTARGDLGRPGPRALPARPARGDGSRWLGLVARPLASDDRRAAFWNRHLLLGVVLSELTCLLGVTYLHLADRPRAATMTVMAAVVMALVPLLLLAPMRRWSRDLRGVTLFYLWSMGTTCAIAAFCILDGGATTPLTWLFVLTLTYAGLAYPPAGVLLMGAFTVGAYAVVAATGPVDPEVSVVQAATLGVLSVMIAWGSRNEWELIRGQEELATRLAVLAETDVLTGALNRRAFDERLAAAAAGTSAEAPLSLCMVDLDGFKRVNDDLGHAVGDALLARIAEAVLGACRGGDTVARLGGDEFAVLLPGTAAAPARAIGERVRRAVAECGSAYHVTASVGVVTTVRPADGTRLLTSADHLMYDAKRSGGDATRSLASLAAG